MLVGSDRKCDLHLDHTDVAPRHCYLQWIDGNVFCCDVAQSTGLFSDRISRAGGRWLAEQSIVVGPYRLSLEKPESQPVPEYYPLERSGELSLEDTRLGLKFQGVEQTNNYHHADRLLTMIGRGSQCKLRLNSKAMAIVQASMLRVGDMTWLINIAGNQTTCVNGSPISIAQIHIGDILQLGPFRAEVVTLPPLAADEIASRKIAFERERSARLAAESSANASTTQLAALPIKVSADQIMISPTTSNVEGTLAEYIQEERSEIATMKLRLRKLEALYCVVVSEMMSTRERVSIDREKFERLNDDNANRAMVELPIEVIRSRPNQPSHNPHVDEGAGVPSVTAGQNGHGLAQISRIGLYIECLNCHEELRVHQKYLGVRVQCNFCSADLYLNPDSDEILKADSYSRCPHCGASLRYESKLIGSNMTCGFCHSPLRVLDHSHRPRD